MDAQGAAIPGATVTISSDQGSKTIVSDSAGRFFAPYLNPGQYSIKVELAGFRQGHRGHGADRFGDVQPRDLSRERATQRGASLCK